ncbi:MAG: LLM class flavin-dependent oxidoreductase, partial [Chloroflexi bacterium]|nr:LLM class flavin-dependent oxidoreductase [Chloroflexota bacterium]
MRYYSWMGEAAEARAKAIPSTHEAVRDALSALEAIGVDEVVLGPAVADIDQLDRAAEIVA